MAGYLSQLKPKLERQSSYQFLVLNLASNSLARVQPAASSITTDMLGATTCPRNGINFDNSLVSVFMGCLSIVFFIVAMASVFAASSVKLPPKTAHKLIVIDVIVTMSAAIPKPGTGTALPAAAATACE